MGKAARWLRGIFGIRTAERKDGTTGGEKNSDRKRWSFGKSGKDSDSSWVRAYISDTDTQQTRHAIAMARATAAAADAALSAAQAAMAVVRLSGHGGRGVMERLAAVRIQTLFRGFLARKALRALKGLVKLQAIVRGFLVRKRAAATLHSMQALFRAQGIVLLAQQRRRSLRHRSPAAAVFSDDCPKIVEIDTGRPKSSSRSGRRNHCPSASMSDYGDDHYHHHHHYIRNFHELFSSPHPTPDCDHDSGWARDQDLKFPTAQNTPRLGGGPPLLTPGKKNLWFPSYMASTESFDAKLRSQSVPRERSEWGPKKAGGVSLSEIIMASRSSCSGIRMEGTYPRLYQQHFEF